MAHLWISLGLMAFSIVLGIIWYGPLFGKKFSWANEWEDFGALPKEVQEQKKKEALPYYWLQALVSLVQMLVLARFVDIAGKDMAVEIALWIWLGFILPMMAGNVIWSMKSSDKRLTILGIGLSYQLVLMLVAGYVFSL